jgi:glycine reductase
MSISVIHYINQFYGGIGAEDKADTPLIVRDGPVGPGRLLQQHLGNDAVIVKTLVCGDNAFHNQPELPDKIVAAVREVGPAVLIAGPAFTSGRYGLACAMLAQRVEAELGIPTVCGMHPENPAAHPEDQKLYIIQTGPNSSDMSRALPLMARLALKLVRQQPIGTAKEEGYIPRGIRRNVRKEKGAEVRAINSLMAKMAGNPFETELSVEMYDSVAAPEPVKDLTTARIALVTECGLVPTGNPDHIEAARATRWACYSIAGMSRLEPGKYESVHGGYDNTWVNADPNRNVPVDALRALESEGKIGQLYDEFLVTCGSVGNVGVMRRIGREMAEILKKERIDGVIVPST